jgi:hypothetical protein
LLFAILFIIPLANALKINEVMYRPSQCSYHYCQWIELYNDESTEVNLINWTLCGKNLLAGYVNRSGFIGLNETLIIPSGSYALITDGGTGTDVYNYFNVGSNIAFHVDANSTCGELSNKTFIFLNDSSKALIDSFLINSVIGANNNNKSLQFNETDWLESMPTPGALNVFPSINITNTTNPPPNETNVSQPANATEPTLSGYNYSIISFPSELAENFIAQIKIINNEEETNFESWSYVYSGSICYSIGGREGNKINTTIQKYETKTVELNNQVNLSEIDMNKSYKLKIKILREGLKTPKEFTYNLTVPSSLIPQKVEEDNITSESETASSDEENLQPINSESQESSGQTYESRSMSTGRSAIYIFAGLMVLFSAYLILKKG